MNMALFWQAALVGILGYLGAVDSIVMGGVAYGFYILGRPLIAGFMCTLRVSRTSGLHCDNAYWRNFKYGNHLCFLWRHWISNGYN